jgi:Domain of unknown function (DUF5658)
MDVIAALFTAAVTIGTLNPLAPDVPTPAAASIGATSMSSVAADGGQTPSLRQLSFTASPSERPGALLPLYASLAVLQGLDIYSTSAAMSRGGVEANPLMKAAGNRWGSTALKAAATAGSIYFVERAWKQNRKGAVILATVINVATAAVVAHNTHLAKAQR